MISSFISYVHQTHDMISVYHITIISHPYPTSYHISSLSYHTHQTGSKGIIDKTIINVALKLKMDKYCETKLISKMDIYFKMERVVFKFTTTFN